MKKLFLPLVCFAFAGLASARAAEKLNVLFIVADDLRANIGTYGNRAVKTPNLDRLAARGVRFEHAYAQYPVCNPSRTSFMTGLRCEQTGVVGNLTMFRSKLPDVVTMSQMLRQQGWYAASFGKIYHVGEANGEFRDGWMDTGKSWDEATMYRATPAGREILEGRNLTGGKLKWCEWGMTAGTDDDQPDGQTAVHSIAAMEKLTKEGKPWMVAAGFHRPHDPFLVPKKYFDLYPPSSIKIHHDPADATPLEKHSLGGGNFAEAFNAFTDQERMEFQRAYYAGVSFTDAQVGRLLDTLDRLKLWDRTLVIFISDHGYHHNERNWWNKNTLFDRSCQVPLIIAAPGATGGQVRAPIVELVDLYPTVSDYTGVKAPHALAGRSLRPVINDPQAGTREAGFTFVSRGNAYGQAIRTPAWRYIQWSDGSAELYDAVKDAAEMYNVVKAPQNGAVVAELKARLKREVPYSHVPEEAAPEKKNKKKA
jgi:iduronate 2-sulfatase